MRGRHTFTDPLLRAHLRAILHGVQCEVDLRDLPLILHRANGIVDVRILVDELAVHLVGIGFTPGEVAAIESGGGGVADSGAALSLKSNLGARCGSRPRGVAAEGVKPVKQRGRKWGFYVQLGCDTEVATRCGESGCWFLSAGCLTPDTATWWERSDGESVGDVREADPLVLTPEREMPHTTVGFACLRQKCPAPCEISTSPHEYLSFRVVPRPLCAMSTSKCISRS